ncbi:MAG: DEAD/DEAH box helicase [Eubacteriales bacterium]|nr:DEAD/DEAH box helicase [Eubacteriales bacterium]
MNVTQYLERLRGNPETARNITYWHTQPAKEAVYAPFPAWLDARVAAALHKRDISQLYAHQAEALQRVHDAQDVVVVTPTASGKTLCYNLPVLDAICRDDTTRALYLFPTKALAADQVSELYEMITQAGVDVKTYTYDGDTSPAARQAVRQAGHIVVTNPDMLHSGIMPHHTKWVKLFENLKFIVIDEVHTYRGVFGSHMANVLRRLLRLCEFYGSHPRIICCSATIANPLELAQNVCGRSMTLVDNNGAPTGEKHFIFYNPPVVNEMLGIRKSAVLEARKLATDLIINRISTIIFARSRVMVEVLLSYLKELVKTQLGSSDMVRGYRGGYLPTERRAIEKGLRDGSVLGVVSTNALELGIDIGTLDVCVLCGYPGNIASTWQQSGRSGRRKGVSATIMVANSSPLNQFIIQHPTYFFNQPPEYGIINADNLYILLSHIKCAAYELPFVDGEEYGGRPIAEILSFLEQQGVLRHVGGTWHWSTDEFPASEISLRSATAENFIIVDKTTPNHRVIGEMDRFTAPMLLHDEAIYLHEGRQYQVEKLDFEDRRAYVKAVEVNYYTDANLAVNLRVIDAFKSKGDKLKAVLGEVVVTAMTTIFKKMRFDTHENIGYGRVNLPDLQMHTSACWLIIDESLLGGYQPSQVEGALLGIGNLLANIAPVYVMCDAKDISVYPQVKSPYTHQPTLFIYDTIPAGMGLSDRLYEMSGELLRQALRMVEKCPCPSGCPSCVGTDGADKHMVKDVLRRLCAQMEG